MHGQKPLPSVVHHDGGEPLATVHSSLLKGSAGFRLIHRTVAHRSKTQAFGRRALPQLMRTLQQRFGPSLLILDHTISPPLLGQCP